MSGAYYNEFDPFAAQTLRNLITKGLIAPGDVDERSIEDVHPDDIRGYTQCHFFAGIGVWSLALRNAGWDDDTRVWTGSCPCQPFSAAGKGDGFADERHLWPAFFHLITQCEPPTVFGEQVASSHVNPWIELVQDDMEALGHRFAAVAFPLRASALRTSETERTGWPTPTTRDHKDTGDLSNSMVRKDGKARNDVLGRVAWMSGWNTPRATDGSHGGPNQAGGALPADAARAGWPNSSRFRECANQSGQDSRDGFKLDGTEPWSNSFHDGPTNDPHTTYPHWRDTDWLDCRDSKWRSVEPGTSPLAHGLTRSMGALDAGVRGLAEMAGLDAAGLRRARSYRVGSLKAYGNAINAVQAEQFIRAYLDA